MKVASTFDAPIIEHFKGIILLSHIHWDITHYFMCKFTSLDTQTEGKNITFDATHINFVLKVLCNKEWPESVCENLCRLHYIEVAGLFGFSLSTNPAPIRESLFKFVFILFCFILPRQGTGPCAPWMLCWGMHRHSCPPVLCGQGCLPPTGHLPGESRSPHCTPNAELQDLLFKSEDYYWQASYLSNRRSTIKIITKLTVEPQGEEFR